MLELNSINNPKPAFFNFHDSEKAGFGYNQSILAKISQFKSIINFNGTGSNYLSSLIEIMLDLNTINNPKPAFLTFTAVKKQVLAISKSILAKISQFKLIININSTSSIYLLSLIEVMLDFNSINNPKPAFLTFTAVKKQVLAISQSILAKISQFKSIKHSNGLTISQSILAKISQFKLIKNSNDTSSNYL